MNNFLSFNEAGNQMLNEAAGGCSSCGLQSGGAKRKLTPYNKFVKKHFKALQKQHPSKSAPEIMKLIGAMWRSTKK